MTCVGVSFAVILMGDMALSVRPLGSCFNGGCGWQADLQSSMCHSFYAADCMTVVMVCGIIIPQLMFMAVLVRRRRRRRRVLPMTKASST